MVQFRRLLCVLGLSVVALALAIGLLNAFGSKAVTHAHARGADTNVPVDKFNAYLHRTTGELADPINLVFEGGSSDTVSAAINRVLGWSKTDGSAMLFEDQGATRTVAAQFGLPLAPGSRLHLRIEADTTQDHQTYTLVGAHRDDSVACGHVGHNFNATRDTITRAFAELGYHVTTIDLGNTEPGRQCDSSMTRGDGIVKVIDLRTAKLPPSPPLFPVGSGFLPPIYLSLP